MVPIKTHAVRKKHYVCEGEKFYIARKEDGKFYYIERIQSNNKLNISEKKNISLSLNVVTK